MQRMNMWTRGREAGGTNSESSIDKRTLLCVKEIIRAKRLIAQGAQCRALMAETGGTGAGGWEGGPREWGYMCAYS